MTVNRGMQSETILLIVGLLGIIIVFLFAIAMGISNGTITMPYARDDTCASDDNINLLRFKGGNKTPTYALSNMLPAGACPSGYTNFTDPAGNTLCCGSSNIDIYNHTCFAPGPEGICSMSPGIEDTRNISGDVRHYPLCQKISFQQQQARSGNYCPRKYQHHVNIPGSNGVYKCCAASLLPGATDCISNASCTGLIGQQNVFNTPNSCEAVLLQEKLICPPGTHMVNDMPGNTKTTKGLSLPICVGVKGNCIPKLALDSLRKIGLFQDINPDKNIMNCDVYSKIYVDRVWTKSQAEKKQSVDLA
jgi:hypothetical protein